MGLIAPDSELADTVVLEVLRSNLADLRDLRHDSEQPPVPAADPLRLEQVRSFLAGVVPVIEARAENGSRPERIALANLSYDALILSVEAWKRALGLPPVPRRRAPPEPGK